MHLTRTQLLKLADKWDEMAGCDQPSITDFNDGKRIAYNDCAAQLRSLVSAGDGSEDIHESTGERRAI